jgi:hypothetical protein
MLSWTWMDRLSLEERTRDILLLGRVGARL